MGDVVYYSLEDIKLNNGKGDARTWFIYKNSVYDATEYKVDHPGGPELVDEWGGKDCTKAFDDAGHSGDAMKELKDLKIGELRMEDRGKKPIKTEKKLSPVVVTVTDKTTNNTQIQRSCMYRFTCGICG